MAIISSAEQQKISNEFLDSCRLSVDAVLEELIPSIETEPKILHQAIRWSLFAGGKRFRPALVLGTGETLGAKRENLVKTAAAIEMIHTYSLIHDDLPAMDDDDLRRGRATCHKKYDEATAILAGDALQSLAFQAIAEDESLVPPVRIKLISELAASVGTPNGMVAGQQLDLQSEGKNISLSELETIHRRKTGALICASARSGAIIARAGDDDLRAISDYAANLGLLFQVTDDLLDVTQTTEVLGKTAGKDVSAEKATYPAFYGVEETGKLAEKIHTRANKALDKIERDTSILKYLLDFILHRQA